MNAHWVQPLEIKIVISISIIAQILFIEIYYDHNIKKIFFFSKNEYHNYMALCGLKIPR